MSIRKNPLLAAAFAMSGCSMAQTTASPASAPGIDAVETVIEAAVENADRANALVVEDLAPPVSALPEGALLPSEALLPINVDWNGPIEDLLEDLAGRAGFEFAVSGEAPEDSAPIEIIARNEPLFGVAVRAAYNFPGRVTVYLDPFAGVLELRWIA